MGYRIFTDAHGTEWQAWDVIPRIGDRRANDRRVRVAPPPHSERRSRSDRRIGAGNRGVLTPTLNEGWLCFEAKDEKRRLAPIPHDWMKCAPERLEQYCAQARVAKRLAREMPAIDLIT